MPRHARLDVPGALHHVMVRGANQSAIFEDERDRARFLERLGEKVTEARASVYAWALMEEKRRGHSILFVLREVGS
jgi:putative transposase